MQVVEDYFSNLFTSTNPDLDMLEEGLNGVNSSLNSVDREFLNSPFTAEEDFSALKMMGPLKALGPDGYHVVFFQRRWDFLDSPLT